MEYDLNEMSENIIVDTSDNTTFYNVCSNIYTMLSVLTITIIVIFMFKYLKSTFKRG